MSFHFYIFMHHDCIVIFSHTIYSDGNDNFSNLIFLVTLGICEAKTCDIMSKRVQARLSGEDVDTTGSPLPQCDEEGRFKPKQCVGEECVCVNEFGFPTREPTDGSCEGE